jgi:hypothetical protein
VRRGKSRRGKVVAALRPALWKAVSGMEEGIMHVVPALRPAPLSRGRGRRRSRGMGWRDARWRWGEVQSGPLCAILRLLSPEFALAGDEWSSEVVRRFLGAVKEKQETNAKKAREAKEAKEAGGERRGHGRGRARR